jgi:hypothetical protein
MGVRLESKIRLLGRSGELEIEVNADHDVDETDEIEIRGDDRLITTCSRGELRELAGGILILLDRLEQDGPLIARTGD